MFLADILGLSLKAEKNGQTVTVLIVPRPRLPATGSDTRAKGVWVCTPEEDRQDPSDALKTGRSKRKNDPDEGREKK
jgi:hypothetical protein